MGSVWCVKPEETTIPDLKFTDEDGVVHVFWIKVRKRLNVGEKRGVETAGFGGFKQGKSAPGKEQETEITVNWQAQSFARTVAYLVDWSLTDDRQNKLPCTRDVVESLHPDVFAAMESAINGHVQAMADEKKASAGNSAPLATSA